jgi:hypothetical protein
MKRTIVFSALVPFLFAGVAQAADGSVITEEGQLINCRRFLLPF